MKDKQIAVLDNARDLLTANAGSVKYVQELEQAVDGVVLETGDRLLIKDPTVIERNGIYRVQIDKYQHADVEATLKLAELKSVSNRSRAGSSKDASKLKQKNRAKAKAARKARKK